ncbi:hypothetical protein [Paracoccus aestuarii]|uniref:hypothetical protein n=1 Tax=Paracoccus aestuarii TaxID=453842 RepID=UPI001472C873|nr:hypothetical protein [Paracoccus aestuarii]WCR00340.1 hypothetical protein JHW48_06590 [Paracoccus aestuarii]
MSHDSQKPLSIADRKRSLEADAVLDQMYGYYTREETPRAVVSDLDARRAA